MNEKEFAFSFSGFGGLRIVALNPGDENYPDEELSMVVDHARGVVYVRADEYERIVAELKQLTREVN